MSRPFRGLDASKSCSSDMKEEAEAGGEGKDGDGADGDSDDGIDDNSDNVMVAAMMVMKLSSCCISC